jgi:hypothetical protein
MSASSVNSSIKALEKRGLIGFSKNGQIKLPRIAPIYWSGTGPLIEKLYREWGAATVRHLARPKNDLGENELFIIHYRQLSEESYRDFLQAHRKSHSTEWLT